MSFVHLHTHSHYSLLDGLTKIKDLVKEAARLEMPALALTDHGNLYGAIEFYKQAKNEGVKPIIGVEAYVASRSLHDREPGVDERRYHLTLLAENEEGYHNLIELVTVSHLEGFYYKPRVDKELLRKHARGVIALSGCFSGEIPRTLFRNDFPAAEKLVEEYKEIFGKDNFFIETSHHPGIPNHDEIQKALRELSAKTKTPLVATQDSHYLKPDDASAQDILLAVQTNTKLDDEDRLTMKADDFSFRPPLEMREFFKDWPGAAENTLEIAKRVNLTIPMGILQLPYFEVPSGFTPESYLEKLCLERLEKRYPNPSPDTKKRLEYELGVIKKTGFSTYFLIVQDLVNWAKRAEIVVGPGRGSAAGSLASYVLGITNVDPIKYNLFFERFMNPDRISPPDFDLDFADTRRNEVLEYVQQKYGRDKVAQIITFGTMAARAAIRDAGRALGMSYGFCDQLAKLIPFNPTQGMKEGWLEHCLKEIEELKTRYQSDPEAKRLLDAALKLEGVARHASVHACGVVMTKEPLKNIVPLQYATSQGEAGSKEEVIVTQYEMRAVEDLGLLKVDFLGLKNLTIIENTLKLVKERHGVELDLPEIEPNDSKVFKTLEEGKTVGVFQLEGQGMTRYLKELRPTNLEDIIAMISLYRPGPMELIPSYIKRKHGREQVTYLHPKLEPILKNTYGIAVYQEQMMQIARDLAGFTLAEADTLRKAIGKKIKSLLAEQKEKFVSRMIANKVEKSIARKLGELLEPFARYGFNRSHAASYARVAFETAYLKTYWPLEFMASLMNSDEKDIDRLSFLMKEAKELEIEVKPPELNTSYDGFAPEESPSGPAIRFGLRAIKNVGSNVVRAIIKERSENGIFTNLEDFLGRIPYLDLNKKSLEALIKSGATDYLGERAALLDNIELLLRHHRESNKQRNGAQDSLFGESASGFQPSLAMKEVPPASPEEKLGWEKELLGLFISGHPLEKFREVLSRQKLNIKLIKSFKAGSPVIVGGIIEEFKKVLTRNNQPMLFLKLADFTDSIEAVVFPRLLSANGGVFQPDACVVLKGSISIRGGNPSIICDEARKLGEKTSPVRSSSEATLDAEIA
ncbi:DNA polymerase III subunit alpha [Candidatus Giovannonibacteria bacterium RIFCSPHIGHO2_01_FULL_48_47]|nr:MAG: DNA polymerase III subunit alpha [Candidatus Giovannonibacteria bacterium RIFCSPHIGHO2_01_FULL_48_47]OGF88738.1 MAG: DNA polymerase III subunit alpha [Candidatus Giovannonibacteria bacterium RIFCSPLOWO2_01_FULL_48_47]OGF95094.1 MAG: DNA polymerase III subunit alpha [Candidatus Giovannonibacteria bacterium RIFOXYC1_FULL_48_8]OGF96100.1 MAG: DNA polymerase III subunit alpha [Candidatus Giovannonibacteria bacterium RIFOXYD1_FULL_48_21]HBT81377.1 DNA polymerase III subunit alpha [Candidatus